MTFTGQSYDDFNPMRSVVEGDGYRISGRQTLNDGEEFTIFIDPVAAGGDVFVEPFDIEPDERAFIDVYENPTVGTTSDDIFVHAMRYDVTPENPQATVTRVNDGELNITGADQTEQTFVRAGGEFSSPGVAPRGLWRIIPVGESIAIRITDDSGGNSNQYALDTVMYEGDTVPQLNL